MFFYSLLLFSLSFSNSPLTSPSLIELGWTISTFGQAAMKNSTQMYVLRTLVGLFEA